MIKAISVTDTLQICLAVHPEMSRKSVDAQAFLCHAARLFVESFQRSALVECPTTENVLAIGETKELTTHCQPCFSYT